MGTALPEGGGDLASPSNTRLSRLVQEPDRRSGRRKSPDLEQTKKGGKKKDKNAMLACKTESFTTKGATAAAILREGISWAGAQRTPTAGLKIKTKTGSGHDHKRSREKIYQKGRRWATQQHQEGQKYLTVGLCTREWDD